MNEKINEIDMTIADVDNNIADADITSTPVDEKSIDKKKSNEKPNNKKTGNNKKGDKKPVIKKQIDFAGRGFSTYEDAVKFVETKYFKGLGKEDKDEYLNWLN